MNYILNGRPRGRVASLLLNSGFDVSVLRPWVGRDGRSYVGRRGEAEPCLVDNGVLRYGDWELLDQAVIEEAHARLRVVADLQSAGLTYTVPRGLGTTVLMTERVSDISEAAVSMAGDAGVADIPEFDLVNLPLPVIHKDFTLNARQIAVSRNDGTDIDLTTARLAARKVAEEAEKFAFGTRRAFRFAGQEVYGLTTYPDRIAYTMVDPTLSGWEPEDTLRDVLAMCQKSRDAFYHGPWSIYNSPDWDQYLDEDCGIRLTLRKKLEAVTGVQSVRTADYLPVGTLLLVQKSPEVLREVVGLNITTVQWEDMGGMEVHFKVMAILVPQIRSDCNGKTGIVHGTTTLAPTPEPPGPPPFDPGACAVLEFVGVAGVLSGGGDTFDCYTAHDIVTADDLPNGGTGFTAAWIAGLLIGPYGDDFDTYESIDDPLDAGSGFASDWVRSTI